MKTRLAKALEHLLELRHLHFRDVVPAIGQHDRFGASAAHG
jgi:hypothetical protein